MANIFCEPKWSLFTALDRGMAHSSTYGSVCPLQSLEGVSDCEQMECAQISVTGGTGTAKPTTYSIPGIYKANDPGLLIDIYSMKPNAQYVIPGKHTSTSQTRERPTDILEGPAKFTCS